MITKERLGELRGTYEKYSNEGCEPAQLYTFPVREILDSLETILRENERLVGLSGKTNYCLQCEAYARENEKLRRVVEAAAKVPSFCCARDECVYYPSDPQCHERLKEALLALRGKV